MPKERQRPPSGATGVPWWRPEREGHGRSESLPVTPLLRRLRTKLHLARNNVRLYRNQNHKAVSPPSRRFRPFVTAQANPTGLFEKVRLDERHSSRIPFSSRPNGVTENMEATARNADAALTDPVLKTYRCDISPPARRVNRPVRRWSSDRRWLEHGRSSLRCENVLHVWARFCIQPCQSSGRRPTTGPDATLRLVSECAQGNCLSRLLEQAQTHLVGPPRHWLGAWHHPAVGWCGCCASRISQDVSHGAIASSARSSRQDGRVLVVEHAWGRCSNCGSPARVGKRTVCGGAADARSGALRSADVVQLGVIALGSVARSLASRQRNPQSHSRPGRAAPLTVRGDVEPLPSVRRY